MAKLNQAAIQHFTENLPQLHTWDDGKTWNSGGFDERQFHAMAEVIELLPEEFSVIETGAGNSTLFYLLCGAKSVVSIAPEEALFDRIRHHAEQLQVSTSALKSFVAFSEDVLPNIAVEAKKSDMLFDMALIDGGHGWPTVFVDFYYIMSMLKPGGYLVVDDIQLFSVKQLAKFLNESYEFTYISTSIKTVIFRKDANVMRLRDFGAQPYILRMTEAERLAGQELSLDY